MPEIGATNGCFYAYSQFILPLWFLSFKKIVLSALHFVNRSFCVLHRRTVGVHEHVRRCQHSLYLLQTRVGLAAEELAGAGAADEFAGVDDGTAAGGDGLGGACGPHALEHGVVRAHVLAYRSL